MSTTETAPITTDRHCPNCGSNMRPAYEAEGWGLIRTCYDVLCDHVQMYAADGQRSGSCCMFKDPADFPHGPNWTPRPTCESCGYPEGPGCNGPDGLCEG